MKKSCLKGSNLSKNAKKSYNHAGLEATSVHLNFDGKRPVTHKYVTHIFLKKSLFRAIKTGRNKRKRNSLGKLSSLVGAMKIHEVLIEDNLVVKKKNLPTDAFYKMVNIRESRRKVAAAGAKNDSDFEYDDIVDSDY